MHLYVGTEYCIYIPAGISICPAAQQCQCGCLGTCGRETWPTKKIEDNNLGRTSNWWKEKGGGRKERYQKMVWFQSGTLHGQASRDAAHVRDLPRWPDFCCLGVEGSGVRTWKWIWLVWIWSYRRCTSHTFFYHIYHTCTVHAVPNLRTAYCKVRTCPGK